MGIFKFGEFNSELSLIDVENFRTELAEELKELQYGSDVKTGSFSDIMHKSDGNMEEEFLMIQNHLDTKDLPFSRIEKLFTEKWNIQLGDFGGWISGEQLDCLNGYIDIYLYRLNEKLGQGANVWLGGNGYDIEGGGGETGEEYYIKYGYGIHRTYYGKIFLEQFDVTPEEFVSESFNHAFEWAVEQLNWDIFYEATRHTRVGRTDFGEVDFYTDRYITSDDARHLIRYHEMYLNIRRILSRKEESNNLPTLRLDEDRFVLLLQDKMKVFDTEDFNMEDDGNNLTIIRNFT